MRRGGHRTPLDSSTDSKRNASQPQTTADYLGHLGVTPYLKDVVALLLENRPENPVQFMADYFSNVVQGGSTQARAHRYVRLTSPERSAFTDNLVSAYMTLEKRSSAPTGITGVDYNRLVKRILKGLPAHVVGQLSPRLAVPEDQHVSFTKFEAGVRAACLCTELYGSTRQLYRQCNVSQPTGARGGEGSDIGGHSAGQLPRIMTLAVQEHFEEFQPEEDSVPGSTEEMEEVLYGYIEKHASNFDVTPTLEQISQTVFRCAVDAPVRRDDTASSPVKE